MLFKKNYKRKFNKLAVLLGTALLISITTSNTMAATDSDDSITTHYQDLMNAFDKAEKAHIGDFPKLTNFSSSHTKCIWVKKSEPFLLVNVVVGRFIEITKGNSDNGPLFPATPDVETIGIAMTSLEIFNTKKDNETMVDFIENVYFYNRLTLPRITSDGSSDLKTISYTPKINDFTDISTYRKSGSELYFHRLLEAPSQNQHIELYGYCYKN